MKRCRCCRNWWPVEFYAVCRPDGLRRSRCMACRRHCGMARRREDIARTTAYRARVRSEVAAVRAARAT